MMRETSSYGVGGVLSADIAVPDHERELGFYSAVLTTGDVPLWRHDLTNNRGTPIIGLGVRTPEYDALPLQWMPHFQVADVASSVAHALDLGGKELMRDPQNQWAVLVDQVGAAFGLIPTVPPPTNPSEISEQSGCISWLTLVVPDDLASCKFYQRVVGWDPKTVEADDADGGLPKFEMLCGNGNAAAEICHNSRDLESVPPVWLISLPVNDFAESLRQVSKHGGEVIKSDLNANYAIIRDPVGACIALQAG